MMYISSGSKVKVSLIKEVKDRVDWCTAQSFNCGSVYIFMCQTPNIHEQLQRYSVDVGLIKEYFLLHCVKKKVKNIDICI